MSSRREIAVVWRGELRGGSLSSRGVVLVGLYVLLCALALALFGWLSTSLPPLSGEPPAEGTPQVGAGAVMVMVALRAFVSEEAVQEALKFLPPVALITFRAALLALPVWVALLGFDQVSGELEPKSIRFLSVRARRSSVLLGKLSAQLTLVLPTLLALVVAIGVVSKAVHPDFAVRSLAIGLSKLALGAVADALAYVCLTALCSTLFRAPAVSLVANFAALLGFLFLEVVAAVAQRQDSAVQSLRAVAYAAPTHYAERLVEVPAMRYLPAVGAYLAFALLFLVLAEQVLRRRDI